MKLSTIGVRIRVGRVRTQSPCKGPSLIFVVQYLIDYSVDLNSKFFKNKIIWKANFYLLGIQMAWCSVTWYHGNQTTIWISNDQLMSDLSVNTLKAWYSNAIQITDHSTKAPFEYRASSLFRLSLYFHSKHLWLTNSCWNLTSLHP